MKMTDITYEYLENDFNLISALLKKVGLDTRSEPDNLKELIEDHKVLSLTIQELHSILRHLRKLEQVNKSELKIRINIIEKELPELTILLNEMERRSSDDKCQSKHLINRVYYKIFIAHLKKKLIINLDLAIDIFESYIGEDGNFVDSETLLKSLD